MTATGVYPRPRSALRATPGVLAGALALAALTVSVLPFFQVLSEGQHEMLDVRTAPGIVYLPPPEEPIEEPPPPEEEPEHRTPLRAPVRAAPTPKVPRVEAPMLTAALPMSGVTVQVGDLDPGLAYEVSAPPPDAPEQARPRAAATRRAAPPDTAPTPVLTRSPPYPDRARSAGIEGYVDLSILVSETGEVDDVRVKASAPRGIFDAICLRAAKRWRFRPATRSGEPAPGRYDQGIRFELR